MVPFDKETVIRSVKKTGRLVIVEEDTKTGSWGGEVAAVIAEEAIDYLDAPIERVSGMDAPIPASPPLESFVIPNEERIINTVRRLFV